MWIMKWAIFLNTFTNKRQTAPRIKELCIFDVFFYRLLSILYKYLMPCMSKARIFSSFTNPKEHLLIFWNMLKAQLARPVKK